MEKKEIKRMHHLFTCVGKKELEEAEHLYSIFLFFRKSEEVVQIPDQYILNNPTFIKGFDTYWDTLENDASGLSYHGMTIFHHESLHFFQQRIENDRYKQNLSSLDKLCSMGIDENLEILHWGM